MSNTKTKNNCHFVLSAVTTAPMAPLQFTTISIPFDWKIRCLLFETNLIEDETSFFRQAKVLTDTENSARFSFW